MNTVLKFPRFLIGISFCLLQISGFAQNTKAAALATLRETFSAKFIKTEVVRNESRTPDFYDYEINDSCIFILQKSGKGGKDLIWVSIRYERIGKISFVESAGFFKQNTGLKIEKAPLTNPFKYGNGNVNGQNMTGDIYNVILPFTLTNDDAAIVSITNAVNMIQKLASEAAATDRLFLQTNHLKRTAYTDLPDYEVFTFDSVKQNLRTYIRNNRTFKDKPTLMITWAAQWCKPCMRLIDSILNAGIALEYNIVLVDRDLASMNFSKLKQDISARTPNYNKSAMLLFDRTNELADMDGGQAPMFVWLDKDLKIVGTSGKFDLKAKTARSILSQIHSGLIVFDMTRYYDAFSQPCTKENAYKKTVIKKLADNSYELSVYNMNSDVAKVKVYYTKDAKGKLTELVK